ncbi:MAG TPA: FMN-binding negative transcriptional regulator [Rhodocyclaceae bacterium]|nr:FMN-binding negative transcriptional regulator [Rhodocyclaceae bacterium]
MYSPQVFIETDTDAIRRLIASAPFATLISVVDDSPLVTHVPIILDKHNWLLGHVACANPHSAALSDGAEVLVIFHGPHAYVSPSWYAEPSVPTWNYAIAHMKARVHVQTGDAAQMLLDALTKAFDDPSQAGHKSHAERAMLLNQIHCFRLEPLQIDVKFKLSQNKSKTDQEQIIAKLSQQEDENSQAIANLMLRNLAGQI